MKQPPGLEKEVNDEVPMNAVPLMATRGWLQKRVNPHVKMANFNTFGPYGSILYLFMTILGFEMCQLTCSNYIKIKVMPSLGSDRSELS